MNIPTTINSGVAGGGGAAGAAAWSLSVWLGLVVALVTILVLVYSMWKLVPRRDRSSRHAAHRPPAGDPPGFRWPW